jgi:hypothetical protein
LETRLVGRSGESAKRRAAKADVAQLAERVLGKDEVTSSILVIGSRLRSLASPTSFVQAGQLSEVCRAEAMGDEGAEADRHRLKELLEL